MIIIMSLFWTYANKAVNGIDAVLAATIGKIQLIDKVKVALYVTWLWAFFGLYTTKAFETFFTALLSMPDNWLEMPAACLSPKIENTLGKKIKILSAYTESGDITNKLKLFLKFYWEKAPNNGNSKHGFDFGHLKRLLNCSMLYCCYLLTDEANHIEPEQFWNNINKFFVDIADNLDANNVSHTNASNTNSAFIPNPIIIRPGLSNRTNPTAVNRTLNTNHNTNKNMNCYMSYNENLSDRRKVFLRNIDFDGYLASTGPSITEETNDAESIVRALIDSFEAKTR